MIQLRLLGPLGLVRGEDGTPCRSLLAQPKRFALLAYLAAVHPPARRRRDTLFALFWPESDEPHARNSLRQSLYQIRRSLGPEVLAGAGDERIGVNPDRIWCDAAAFDEALAHGRLETAVDLYRGPLLEGFHLEGVPGFERWLEREERRRRLAALEAVWALAGAARAADDRAGARSRAEQALQLAPYDGEGLRRYLALMAEIGQPAAALRAYRKYVERLSTDLDLSPSAETRVLAESIRGGDVAPEGSSPERTSSTPGSDRPAPEAPERHPELGRDGGTSDEGEASTSARTDVEADDTDAGPSWWQRRIRRVSTGLLLGLAVLGLVGIAALGDDGPPGARASDIRSLAVLPLENLSGDPEQGYFTDGMTEALIAALGEIDALKVISRTSAMSYRDTDKRVPEIARELDVDGLIEGSVLRDGDRVRITLQLLHGPTDRHLWARSWERPLRGVLELQDEVARAIARTLQAQVSQEAARRIAEPPTDVTAAYSYYLRGNDYLRRESRKNWELAERMYGKAVELDPSFAKAWERLVYVRGVLSVSRFDTARVEGAREALERLRELGPDAEETHAGEGWSAYWVEHDLDRALREFEILHRRRPRDPEILWAVASVHWRAARWEDAVPPLRRLLELDPRNPEVARRLAQVLTALRRFGEAEEAIDIALSLAPDNHFSYVTKWRVLALGQGDTARAAQLVGEAGSYVRPEELAWLGAIVSEFRRDFSAAIEGFRSWPAPSWTKYQYVARLAGRTGDSELAAIYADSLEQLAKERLEQGIRHQNVRQMAVARYHLGRAYATPGHLEDAVREGEEGLRLLPLGSSDSAPMMAQNLVWIYARAGHHREAVQLLERLLEVPGGETVASLRLNPVYDDLRAHPAFQALLRTETTS